MVTDIPLESKNLIDKNKLIRSFGRIKSRKISDRKNQLLQDNLNFYSFSDLNCDTENNILEIGFGFGDFIFNQAKNNPDINFFGCEPHINGIVYLLSKLKEFPLNNLKISNQDARIVIDTFPDQFFKSIYILFPDPWPKVKHFKRRLVDCNFLDNVLARKIKTKGEIIIATDHNSYKTWILSCALRSNKFYWNAENSGSWKIFPHDWTITKYQRKALEEGRESIFIKLVKND